MNSAATSSSLRSLQPFHYLLHLCNIQVGKSNLLCPDQMSFFFVQCRWVLVGLRCKHHPTWVEYYTWALQCFITFTPNPLTFSLTFSTFYHAFSNIAESIAQFLSIYNHNSRHYLQESRQT